MQEVGGSIPPGSTISPLDVEISAYTQKAADCFHSLSDGALAEGGLQPESNKEAGKQGVAA